MKLPVSQRITRRTYGNALSTALRCGERCRMAVYPHLPQHHFSHTWLDRGAAAVEPGRQNDACAVLAVSTYLTGPDRTLLRFAVSG